VYVIPRLDNVTYCKVTSDKWELCYVEIYLRRILKTQFLRDVSVKYYSGLHGQGRKRKKTRDFM
jgi:hypothetical protein